MSKKHLRLAASSGEIHVMMNYGNDLELRSGVPAVVFSHGFTVPGFESRRMFIEIAEQLVTRGWLAILFDYRGSGYSDLSFPDMTIKSEVEDLTRVLEHTRSVIGADSWLGLWGMSMGTAIAAEVAAQHESNINGLVAWSLSADLYWRFLPRYEEDFARQGYSVLPAGFTIKPSLVESMRYVDTYASLRELSIPRIFVNGDADTSTDIEMAEKAVNEARGDVTLVRIPGGVHGFKGQPDLFEDALSQTISWLEAHWRRSALSRNCHA